MLWVLGPLAVLVLLGAVLLAVTVPGVRDHLTASRKALVAAQDALASGDQQGARAKLALAQRHSRAALHTSDGLVWRAFSHLPVAGPSVREVRALTTAVDTVTSSVLPPLVTADVVPGRWTGRVDPAPFVALRAPLATADRRLADARRRLRAAPSSRIDLLGDARIQLDDGLTRLARTLAEAHAAADAVPGLVTGERTYLLGVQNNAEQRATGGLLGAYAVLHVSNGALRLEQVGPDQDLRDPDRPVLDLGEEYEARYGRFQTTSTWRSANLSPDTPTVGRIVAALWKQRTGTSVDGVLLVDPVGLARLLGGTGPVVLADGTRLTQQNAVRVLLVDAYRRFPRTEDAARNAYLQAALSRVVVAVTGGGLDGARLVRAVGGAVAGGHLQVWAADPTVESALVRSRVGGALPAAGPFLEVVTQDAGGSKLGVYQRRSVRYDGTPTGEAVDLGDGPVLEEAADVTVVLTNTAPAGLPAYVTLRPDDPKAPVGQSRTWVSVYLGRGATLLSATLDGAPVALESTTEQGLAAFSTFVSTDRGASSTLRLRVRQPAAPGQALLWRQQPLVRPDDLVVRRYGAPLDRVYDSGSGG